MSTERSELQIVDDREVVGEFVRRHGEKFYVIRNVDKMPPFFINVVSDGNHWLYVASNGGVTAGRTSPEQALFPYITVDKVYDSPAHTGPKTVLRLQAAGSTCTWEPFSDCSDRRFAITRNLYKNALGNKLCFEEINHSFQVAFRYTWSMAGKFGFARQCELENLSDRAVDIALVDGLRNLLPAGTPRVIQGNTSNLVDAYKWTEVDEASGLGLFTLYAGITDRAEPSESLLANTVFCLGLDNPTVFVTEAPLERFREGATPQQQLHSRGVRGCYFVHQRLTLPAGDTADWQLVADIEQSQGAAVSFRKRLADPGRLASDVATAIATGSEQLARILGSADAFQCTGEDHVAVHHYANVLFNVLRGGVIVGDVDVVSGDLSRAIRRANRAVSQRHSRALKVSAVAAPRQRLRLVSDPDTDPQLRRLLLEYLPVSFSRRHGDPSRPWNHFVINLEDQHGQRLIAYQGNWRDIFQNWEALCFSFPDYLEAVIAKFVNASTMDGYNPYRITDKGIDWEVQEPDDPWSFIGYWGDHQVIYLLKLLEWSRAFHPQRLANLCHEQVFCYANVPYRIRPFDACLRDPKNTIDYDNELAQLIEERVREIGSDGKLVLDDSNEVYLVSLMEKLLVPLLAKLGNLVVDGGIWMNTQRPEWNDANNALVGHGLSMVTLYYLRRYVNHMLRIVGDGDEELPVTSEVAAWLDETAAALGDIRPLLEDGPISVRQRFDALQALGRAASHYREAVYRHAGNWRKVPLKLAAVRQMLRDALAVIDHSIDTNQRQDGLFEAYNLIDIQDDSVSVNALYPMLEGQVAALSSGNLSPERVIGVVEALFESSIYRADQNSFLLYPDRPLPGFLERNRVPASRAEAIPLITDMLAANDARLMSRDEDGWYRFNAELHNARNLREHLDVLQAAYGDTVEQSREALLDLYEQTFRHRSFTGRSGTMFGFEGLGCIYWHMVAKLLLAVQEQYFVALDEGQDAAVCNRLAALYYRVREGLCLNKTPAEYGAFPTDPYSHTPGHSGAQQPGMTGQVKEEVLSRFRELGIRVRDGSVCYQPALLRKREFLDASGELRVLDTAGNWETIELPARSLGFSWCQVPHVYRLAEGSASSLCVRLADGTEETFDELRLPAGISDELFARTGRVRRITVTLAMKALYAEDVST